MRGLNEYYPTRVLTPNGIVDAKELCPGDSIYEYKSGNRKKVLDVKEVTVDDMIRITYSDGRTIDVGSCEPIYVGDYRIMMAYETAFNPKYYGTIDQNPVNYARRKFRKRNEVKPYIAGALLINGDFEDEYVNLPMDRISPNAVMEFLRDMKVSEEHGDNMIYFTTAGDHPSVRIKWTELFDKTCPYPPTRNSPSYCIPDKYVFNDQHVRSMFIRGAFDGGYDPTMFSHGIGIAAKDENRLKAFQPILWSMGILSTVRYDPDLPNNHGRVYRLDVVDWHRTYPGIFYNVMYINKQIDNCNTLRADEPLALHIIKMESIKPGWRYQVMLERPNMMFMTDNYLPRVSI